MPARVRAGSFIGALVLVACGGGGGGGGPSGPFDAGPRCAPAAPPADGAGAAGGTLVAHANGIHRVLGPAALTTAALAANPEIEALLRDNPDTREFFQYLVQCALPEDAEPIVVSPGGDELTFRGAIGFAPEWATGPCGIECQEWVSACMFARTNEYGITVYLGFRGSHPAAAPDPEVDAIFSVEEGAFYGNIFLQTPRGYACRGRGYDPLIETFRICAQPGYHCNLPWVGECDDACDRDETGGFYTGCGNRARAGDGTFPDPTTRYDRVITTYLARSSFGECNATPPPAPPPMPIEEVPEGRSRAGVRCENDDACDSDQLFCIVGPALPVCSAVCTDGDVAAEEAQCGGPGSTCVLQGDESTTGSCVRACSARAGRGALLSCPDHQVCTGFWLGFAAGPDDTGCVAWCRDDGDCIRGAACNPRLGACGPGVDPTLLADGEPCRSDSPVPVCRGTCAQLGPMPGEGICISLIDFSRTLDCPDDPEMRALGNPSGDDLGVCAFAPCTGDADCTAPLICRAHPALMADVCQYPL